MVKELPEWFRGRSREKCIECGKPAEFWVINCWISYSYDSKTGKYYNPQVAKEDEWRPEEIFYCAECFAYWKYYTNEFCCMDRALVESEVKKLAKQLRKEK
jgi:hypothetical protein